MLLVGNLAGMSRLLLVVLAWFFGSGAFANDDALNRQSQLDQFAYEAPIFLQGRQSLEEFRKLGKLKGEKRWTEISPYDNVQKNEFVEMRFDGLSLSGRIQKKSFKLIQVKITNSRWKILFGLHVGTSVLNVRRVLGQPTNQEANTDEYCGETDCAIFSGKNGLITKINFSYYSD